MTDEEYEKMKADYDNLTNEQKDAVDREENRRWYEERKKTNIQIAEGRLDGLTELKRMLENVDFLAKAKTIGNYLSIHEFQMWNTVAIEAEKYLMLLDDDMSETQKELERYSK